MDISSRSSSVVKNVNGLVRTNGIRCTDAGVGTWVNGYGLRRNVEAASTIGYRLLNGTNDVSSGIVHREVDGWVLRTWVCNGRIVTRSIRSD